MKKVLGLGMAAIVGLLFAGRGESQDPELKAAYGQIKLKEGFEPDPVKVKVDAGGDIETELGGVKAYVAKPPDYKVFYEAGNKFPLYFYAKSDKDTTLLINDPDGKWHANDDGPGFGLNPIVKFAKPKSGRYDIWVGTFNKGETPPAVLYISELEPK